MRHRVDDVINSNADAEGGEFFRVSGVVGVFPGVAEVHIVTDGGHDATVIVVDAAPAGNLAVFFVYPAAVDVLHAGDLVPLVEIEDGVEDGIAIGDVDDF